MLLTPGPVEVPAQIRAAGEQPIIHHRLPEFRRLLAEVGDFLRGLLGSSGTVVLHAGSGTLAMESAVANVCRPGDRVIVARTGEFGDRFYEMACARGADAVLLAAPQGCPVSPDALKAAVAGKPVRAVLLQHVDTSTGVRNDLAELAAVARDAGALVVVDAVASVLTEDLRVDEWGLDVVVTASQKGLMCPPGASVVVVSQEALTAAADATAGVYLSWTRRPPNAGMIANFTPPVPLVYALHRSTAELSTYDPIGLTGAHQDEANRVRAGLETLGFTFDVAPRDRAAFVSVARPPSAITATGLRHELLCRGVVVATGDGAIRIGHYLLNRRCAASEVVARIGDAVASANLVAEAVAVTQASGGSEPPPAWV